MKVSTILKIVRSFDINIEEFKITREEFNSSLVILNQLRINRSTYIELSILNLIK